MFKLTARSQSETLRALSADEIEFVSGGNKPGPNGEGCTEPRRPTKGGTVATTRQGAAIKIQ
jgi:hypothetical protein